MSEAFITHGACSWIELYTEHKESTKAFYSQLFGWQIADQTMPDGTTYSVINVSDAGIGGIVENKELSGGNGGWGIYITVESVDETAKTVTALDGTVLVPAFDVPGVGRIVKIADPTGAQLSVITYA